MKFKEVHDFCNKIYNLRKTIFKSEEKIIL